MMKEFNTLTRYRWSVSKTSVFPAACSFPSIMLKLPPVNANVCSLHYYSNQCIVAPLMHLTVVEL